MSDLNKNDPLEEFFQKKTQEYNISYREKDWKALEERLDAVDAQYAARRRRQLAAAVVLIIFSVLAYFTYQNYQEINSLNEQLSQNEEITGQPSESQQENTVSDVNQSDIAVWDRQDQVSESSEETEETKDTSPATVEQESIVTGSEETNPEEFATNFETFALLQNQCPTCEFSSLNQITMVDRSSIQPTSNNPKDSAILAANTSDEESGHGLSSPVHSNPQASSRVSLGFVAGPDLSTVGAVSDFQSPGYKIGVTFEYRINEKWSISTGAIRSDVRYSAEGRDYQPPQGYWDYGIQASHTRAQCIIIDIPITISYQFLEFEQSRMYASTGFASYIMLNEDYRFSYDSDQPGLPERWNEDTGTTHFMSNASFSVGYELDIARNISLRAEPFLRIPIKKVGWGNVDLYSVGTLLSLNYNL